MSDNSSDLESSLTEMDWLARLNVGGDLTGLVDAGTTDEAVPERNASPDEGVDLDYSPYREGYRSAKPPFSYTYLISSAIQSTPDLRMALSDIYAWIVEQYPYYKTAASGWKNSVRHNLSLNKNFVKVARRKDDPGKGSYWALSSHAKQNLPQSSSQPQTSLNQMVNHSVIHSVNHAANHLVNHSMNHSVNHSMNHSVNQSVNHSVNHALNHHDYFIHRPPSPRPSQVQTSNTRKSTRILRSQTRQQQQQQKQQTQVELSDEVAYETIVPSEAETMQAVKMISGYTYNIDPDVAIPSVDSGINGDLGESFRVLYRNSLQDFQGCELSNQLELLKDSFRWDDTEFELLKESMRGDRISLNPQKFAELTSSLNHYISSHPQNNITKINMGRYQTNEDLLDEGQDNRLDHSFVNIGREIAMDEDVCAGSEGLILLRNPYPQQIIPVGGGSGSGIPLIDDIEEDFNWDKLL